MTTWTFGPGGVYTATYDGVDTLTVTLTATGAFVESFSGQSLSSLLSSLQQLTPAQPVAAVVSGQYLCPPNAYGPSVQAVLTTTSATLAAMSSANISTGSFTAPLSGSVVVGVSGLVMQITADADEAGFGLCAHGTTSPVVGTVLQHRFSVSQAGADSSFPPVGFQFLVTGLTPGAAYDLDLMWAVAGATTLTAYACSVTSVSPPFSNATLGAPIVMTVQAV